jgi:RHS repeat-associated protein
VVNSTLGHTTTTYFPGKHYSVEEKGGALKVQKHYAAGSTIIAVRTVTAEADTLKWMISDQIGSTSTTVNVDGTWNSDIRYTAFGEIRLKTGVTASGYRYTGQLDMQGSIGLDYYVARFYDPQLARFAQADTQIPDPGKSVSFDRYAYVHNNPIKFSDPTGYDAGFAVAGLTRDAFMYLGGYSNIAPQFYFTSYRISNLSKKINPIDFSTANPIGSTASNLKDLLGIGIVNKGAPVSTRIIGEGLQSLQDDPNVKETQEFLKGKIKSDPRYQKEEFDLEVVKTDDSIHANGPSKKWYIAFIQGNQAFFMVHTAEMSAINTHVDADGTIHTTFCIEDQFDYYPAWIERKDEINPKKILDYLAYNITASIIAPMYHGLLGADSFPTNAIWGETIPPE